MSFCPPGLQLVEQQDLPLSKGMWKQPSQNKNVGWGADILGWKVTKVLAGWISYSGFIKQTWFFAFPLYPKALCQQALVSNKVTRCLTASSPRGLTARFGHLSAFSRVRLWMQMPSPLSPGLSVNKPTKDPISSSCSVFNWEQCKEEGMLVSSAKGILPFPGAGDLRGGIHITAFLRQCGSTYIRKSLG